MKKLFVICCLFLAISPAFSFVFNENKLKLKQPFPSFLSKKTPKNIAEQIFHKIENRVNHFFEKRGKKVGKANPNTIWKPIFWIFISLLSLVLLIFSGIFVVLYFSLASGGWPDGFLFLLILIFLTTFMLTFFAIRQTARLFKKRKRL